MNYVIFSYSFPPRNGAETFCSARFASALALAGHNVHVVTMDHRKAIDDDVYELLVDKRIKVTRIPLSAKRGGAILHRILYRTRGREAGDFRKCIATLRNVLKATPYATLISRSMPEASGIVAWHCRHYASRWIAHFSDPFPWSTGKANSISGRITHSWGLAWGRKIIRDADAISLTCETAKRYFSETYGKMFDEKPVIVTPHIGEPPLVTSRKWEKDCQGQLVVHTGGLGKSRGACQIVDAIGKLNDMGSNLSFYQVGETDNDVRAFFMDTTCAKVISDKSPDLAMAVSAAADISFIPDMRTYLPYSPFLPSKFVYQIFSDTPIVVYSFKDSAMARYAEAYPKAGIIVADCDEDNSLVDAIRKALSIDRRCIDRTDIRTLFTRKTIGNLYSSFAYLQKETTLG